MLTVSAHVGAGIDPVELGWIGAGALTCRPAVFISRPKNVGFPCGPNVRNWRLTATAIAGPKQTCHARSPLSCWLVWRMFEWGRG